MSIDNNERIDTAQPFLLFGYGQADKPCEVITIFEIASCVSGRTFWFGK